MNSIAEKFILSKHGEKPMVFEKINDSQIRICYSAHGKVIAGEYHPPVAAVHKIEFARKMWQHYKEMGWYESPA